MNKQIKKFKHKHYVTIGLFILCQPLYASFIEQTLGTAVVKDATAVYFNPASLTIIPSMQLIIQDTLARSESQFSGSTYERPYGVSESGTTNVTSNFSLPAIYGSIPINDNFTAGFAIIINDFNRELGEHSILRYAQARNETNNIDFVPALGVKINEFLSLGGNINFSQAHFIQKPISGMDRLNIPESRGINDTRGNSLGGDLGILIKSSKNTALGLNYRSAMTYHLHGSSTLANQGVSSNNYHFNFWTPARSVLSISHFLNEDLGFIGTIQYLQWSIFKKSYIYNFATQVGSQAFINPVAPINYNFHNSWLLTLGTIYHVSSKWIVRIATTYTQSPTNGRSQIGMGDNLVVGASMGYQLMQNLTIDGSYGHAFFEKENINISTAKNIIKGINQGEHDAVSLKFTLTA